VNMLRTPAYSIPLVINLTGSIWFFLLVGKHGMSTSMSTSHPSWSSVPARVLSCLLN
jgi:hypothetical protein